MRLGKRSPITDGGGPDPAGTAVRAQSAADARPSQNGASTKPAPSSKASQSCASTKPTPSSKASQNGAPTKPTPGSARPAQRQPAKLAPGSRLPATAVRASQRERLMIALIETVDSGGLAGATVGDLIARAHVARAAFYQQFDGLEQFFLATYDAQVERVAEQVTAAYDGARGLDWGERVEATMGALARAAWDWPAAARVCLVDMLAAGPGGHGRRAQPIALVRQLLGSAGAGAGARPQVSRDAAIAVTGGLRRLIYAGLREGGARTDGDGSAARLAGELASWLLACRPPSRGDTGLGPAANRDAGGAGAKGAGERFRDLAEPRMLVGAEDPDGPAGRRSEAGHLADAAHEQPEADDPRREQIVEAVLELAASKGYGAMTQRDVARRAKVSFSTFYEHFENKEQALLAASRVASERLLSPIEVARADANDWPHAVRAGIAAYLRAAAESPDEARMIGLELLGVGHAGGEQLERHANGLERLLAPGFELTPELGPTAGRAFAGAAVELLRCYAGDRRTAELPQAGPELSYLALAPFIGRKDAQRIAGYRPRYRGRAGGREPLTFERAGGVRRRMRRR
jgi:AcrR family transcriptional regulator